jgi:hypothetical protein
VLDVASGELATVLKQHGHLIRAANDVLIREDDPAWVHNEARTDGPTGLRIRRRERLLGHALKVLAELIRQAWHAVER